MLDDPSIVGFSSAKLQLQTADTGLLIDRDVSLPDQWRANTSRSFSKSYFLEFEHSNLEALAFFVPFAQDQVTLFLNGEVIPALHYTRGRTYWLWNKPLLFRFAAASLRSGANSLELKLASTGSSRVALGKVYLGPLEKMDTLYLFFWRAQVGVPFAICVLMTIAAIAFAAYAPIGGKLFWTAAGFNLSGAITMANWLLAAPLLEPHVWFAAMTFFEYVALLLLTVFFILYLRLRSWVLAIAGSFIFPILSLSVAAMFMGDMDTTMNVLESAEVAWGIGGVVLSGLVVWCYFKYSSLDAQAIIWGVVLLIAFGLRDTFVHLGMLPATLGLHIPIGFAIVTFSMIFISLRMAIRHASGLENYRLELGRRVEEHAREIDQLTAKQSELELTAIAGRLSQIYSHELRNPIGTSLASGNLALKQLNTENDPLRQEAQHIVRSSMVCSELLGQILAAEEGLFPGDSQVPLMMPEWLIAHSEDLSSAIGSRLSVGDSVSVRVLAKPRSLLQALGLLLSDICVHQSDSCTVTAVVNCIGPRAQLMFFFSKPVPISDSDRKDWAAKIASAQAMLSVDNASLQVLYDGTGCVYACLIDAQSAPENRTNVEAQVR